ncbi:MAG: Gldg family protein, partial [Planctomycetota bacterium]
MAAKPVIGAIFRRDLWSWFTNPTGYVFITLFVLLCAFALFIPPKFFLENTASLGPLQDWFRVLLLFFIPAITMMVWAGERGQGTDEILLTLPASDSKIVLGKFLAACGVYTVSLAFTFLLPVWLQLLGKPDWGLILTSYFAFWSLGVFLISVGMVGSLLTDNLTVAFILGAVFCAIAVFLEDLLGMLAPRSFLGDGPVALFEQMSRGLVTLPALVFFGGSTAVFLYLNRVLLSQRRWTKAGTGLHLLVRLSALVAAVLALTVVTGRIGVRMDLTSEGLHSLTSESKDILDDLDPERPVTVRAWISPEVPRDYIPVRRELLDLLREYDARGGEALSVEIIETRRFTDEAREAETNFGVRHRPVFAEEGARRNEFAIYLGLAFTAGAEEVVIPFLERGLSVEYELTRSLRVVAGSKRPKVGVLDTDAKIFGGFDFRTGRQDPQWEIIRELRLQYELVRVDPNTDYADDLEMLFVAQTSSLTQPQMDRLLDRIKAGVPALLFDDPFPNSRPDIAPSAAKGGQPNPMMGMQPPNRERKGDIRAFYRTLGIEWNPMAIAWDSYNPHPDVPAYEEWVFVGAESGASAPFHAGSEISSGLQEVLVWFGGTIRESLDTPVGRSLAFVPLMTTTEDAGILTEREIFSRNMFGQMSINTNRSHIAGGEEICLAARVTGRIDGEAENDVDVVMIPDLDFINLPFLWQFRREGNESFNFDNVTF